MNLAVAANVVKAQVTAEDGPSTGIYVLTLTQAAISTDTTLQGIEIKDVNGNAVLLIEGFDPVTLAYGWPAFDGRYTTTPAIGIGLTEAGRE